MGNTAATAGTYAPVAATEAAPFPPLMRLFGRPRATASASGSEKRAAATDFARLHAVLGQLTQAIDDMRVKAARRHTSAREAQKHEGAETARKHLAYEKRLLQQSARYQSMHLAIDAAVTALEQQALTGASVVALAACTRDMAAMLRETSPDDVANVREQLDEMLALASEAATGVSADLLGGGSEMPTPWYERDTLGAADAALDDDAFGLSSSSRSRSRSDEALAAPVRPPAPAAADEKALMEEVSLI